MKVHFYLAILLLTLTAPLFGHPAPAGNWDGEGESHPGNLFTGYSPGSTYVGIFPGYREGFYHRGHQGAFTSSGFHQMSTMNNYRDYYYGSRYYRNRYYQNDYYNRFPMGFFMLSSGWNRTRFGPENLYTSKNFVEEWKDRPPETIPASSLDNSPLLARDMTQEEVVGVLGSPIRKVRFEGREIWKYSSFSLVFDNGLLTELR